jgi:hypothetical protein
LNATPVKSAKTDAGNSLLLIREVKQDAQVVMRGVKPAVCRGSFEEANNGEVLFLRDSEGF